MVFEGQVLNRQLFQAVFVRFDRGGDFGQFPKNIHGVGSYRFAGGKSTHHLFHTLDGYVGLFVECDQPAGHVHGFGDRPDISSKEGKVADGEIPGVHAFRSQQKDQAHPDLDSAVAEGVDESR